MRKELVGTWMALALTLTACGDPDIVIGDFSQGRLDGWVIEGNAFRGNPMQVSELAQVTGAEGAYLIASRRGDSLLTGSMTTQGFEVTRDYINLLLGGSTEASWQQNVAAELLIDGEVVRHNLSISRDAEELSWLSWNVEEYHGKTANVRLVVDSLSNPGFFVRNNGYLYLGKVVMSNKKASTYIGDFSTVLKASEDYLLLPAANKGKASRLSILVDGKNILGEPQTINIASNVADYYIPIYIKEYQGKDLKVCLTRVDWKDLVCTGIKQSDDRGFEREEPFRQVYHFTPDFGWTNDPNGMVYANGTYHLAYQANPYGTRHNNMHWGHAVSKDLLHWDDQPFIIAPDSLGSIFSGSATIDPQNLAGFGKDALLAIYTSAGRSQSQSIAYSTDGGQTYQKYEANPVLTDASRFDFRDPKVLWLDNRWILSVAAHDVIAFYESKDFKHWDKLSEFGKGIGSHTAVWECPDLMKMTIDGKEKWVLLVSINPGGPNGGSVTQYFIGDFNGKEFKADALDYPLWIDEGTDNYAGVTFSNTGERHIFMGWMSNWLYANETPTVNFRNSMTLPRDLKLKRDAEGNLFLASMPSQEVFQARRTDARHEDQVLGDYWSIDELLPQNNGAYEIDFTVRTDKDGRLVFRLYNERGEEALFNFDFGEGTLTLDRSKSGIVDFYEAFAAKDIKTKFVRRGEYKVQLFVDRMSTELFINDGDLSFTNTVFPHSPYNAASFRAEGGRVSLSDIHVYEMK